MIRTMNSRLSPSPSKQGTKYATFIEAVCMKLSLPKKRSNVNVKVMNECDRQSRRVAKEY